MERLLNVKEVMALMGMSRTGFYRAVQKGDIPRPMKFGGASRWAPADLEEARRKAQELANPATDKGIA